MFRLLEACRREVATGLISKRWRRRSNRRKPEALRRAVLAMIREWRHMAPVPRTVSMSNPSLITVDYGAAE